MSWGKNLSSQEIQFRGREATVSPTRRGGDFLHFLGQWKHGGRHCQLHWVAGHLQQQHRAKGRGRRAVTVRCWNSQAAWKAQCMKLFPFLRYQAAHWRQHTVRPTVHTRCPLKSRAQRALYTAASRALPHTVEGARTLREPGLAPSWKPQAIFPLRNPTLPTAPYSPAPPSGPLLLCHCAFFLPSGLPLKQN